MSSPTPVTSSTPSPAGHVLVTGGAGFIGGHLCAELLERGSRITVLDDLSTGHASNLAGMVGGGRLRLIRGSVCDAATVRRAFEDRPDVVIHLAAAVGVRLIVERPVESIAINIRGTELVLEQAAEHNIKTLIASSSEVYGKGVGELFREDADLLLGPTVSPRWSYACSKMIDEFLALAYARDQNLPVVVMRFFNTVGPRQSGRYGMVIPRLVRQALSGEPLTVYGDGRQTRAFCHVRDTVRMVADLAELPEANGQIFNVGNDEEISIGDLARLIIEMTGSSSPIRLVPFDEAYDPQFEDLRRRVPCLAKVQQLLGYRPTRNIRQIIQEVRDHEFDRR